MALDFDRIPCIGYKCKNDCTSEKECKKKNGKVIDEICFLCGVYEKYENKQCIPNCQANEVFENGKCVCEEGFIKLIDKCVSKCGINYGVFVV